MQTLLFRDSAVTSDYRNFATVLLQFEEHDRLLQAELQRMARLKSSQAHRVFRDAKLLGLLKNGDGLSITSLGRRWAQDITRAGQPSAETLRQAAANVPLFARALVDLPGVQDAEQLFVYFTMYAGEKDRNQEIGSAVRRYLEAFFTRQLPRALPRTKAKLVIPATRSVVQQPDRAQALVGAIGQLADTYGADAVLKAVELHAALKK
jgi:hypothetical protein